jgi:hypothetical protein
MRTTDSIETNWQALVSRLLTVIDLDASARASGALVRRRCVGDAATLLRLALAYGPGGMSLRSAAAWAGLNDVAQLSDVALLKRLRGSADWLGTIAGALLANVSSKLPSMAGRRLRIADGSSISHPGSSGTDFRLHATYEPALARFTHLELTDAHGGEGFSRIPIREGDIIIGDRAYARAPSLEKVVAAGGDFIVRTGWAAVRLTTLDGELVDWNAIYQPMRPGEVCDIDVLVEHAGHKSKGRGKPIFQARLIVMRKANEATAKAQKVAKKGFKRRRNNGEMQPMTMTAAGFVMLLTSITVREMRAEDVLETYRIRWQVELAFKRLKSGLGMHRLPARDQRLGRSWLTAHLILALLIDETMSEVLDSPPCEEDSAHK